MTIHSLHHGVTDMDMASPPSQLHPGSHIPGVLVLPERRGCWVKRVLYGQIADRARVGNKQLRFTNIKGFPAPAQNSLTWPPDCHSQARTHICFSVFGSSLFTTTLCSMLASSRKELRSATVWPLKTSTPHRHPQS